MEFGSTVCPLERPPGAGGILTLIIHINLADPLSNNEPCKWHQVTKEAQLKTDLLSSFHSSK